MRIKKVSAENFLSYRKLVVDFERYKDRFVLIEGKVNDKQKTDSNGSGKSSIIESVVYGLYGKTIRNIKYSDDVINGQIKKDCKVVVEFGDYVVERYRKHRKHKNSLFFIKQEGDDVVDLRGNSDTETQERINHSLGMDYSCFVGSHIFAGNSTKFTTISDSERKEILRTLSNAEWVEKCLEKVKLSQSKNNEVYRSSQLEFSKITGVIEGLESYVKDASDNLLISKENYRQANLSLDKFEKSNEFVIDQKNIEISNIENEIQAQNDLIFDHLAVINKHKFDIEKSNKIDEDVNSKELEIEVCNNSLNICKEKILKAKKEIESFSLICDDLNLKLEKEINEIKDIVWPDKKMITKMDQEKALLVDSLSKDIFKDLSKDLNSVSVDIGVINSNIEKDNKQVLKYSSGVETYCHSCSQEISQSHINKLSSKVKKHLSNLKRDLKRTLSHKSSIESNLEVYGDIKSSISKIEQKKIEIQKTNDLLEMDIVKRNSLIESLKQKVEISSVKIESINAQIESWQDDILFNKNKINSCEAFVKEKQQEKNLIGVIKDVIVKNKRLEAEIRHIKDFVILQHNEKIKEINRFIKSLESEKLNLENSKKNAFDKLSSSKLDHKNLIDKLESNKKILMEVKVRDGVLFEDGKKLDLVSNIFGKGGIQNHIFNMIIPEFKNKVNYYVSQLADDIAVDISTQLEQKKNTVSKINFNPYVIRGGGSGYSCISSGQKRKVDIAATMAIKSLYGVFGKGLGFSFYDEILDNLDSTGVNQVVDMLKRDSGTRFLITHNNDIKSEFDEIMTVEMSKNISEVK